MNHQGRVFFLDVPGGTGKTFLINLLLAQIRSSGKVASSGITVTLSGGRTAHSISSNRSMYYLIQTAFDGIVKIK